TSDFSSQLNDYLVPICLKAFDVMYLILNSDLKKNIVRTLSALKREYSTCLSFENTDELTIRYIMFGIIDSLHLTLLHMTGKRSGTISNESSKGKNKTSNSTLRLQPGLLIP
ncbi:hypothetical protein PMAYCL1PPCAC_13951, partial [Pristionchus mayeri]